MLRLLVLVCVLVALVSAAPSHAQDKGPTLRHVSDLLAARRLADARGKEESATAELRRMDDLPKVRWHCRRMFAVVEVTDRTLEALVDHICVTDGVGQEFVYKMTLAQVARRLDRRK